MLILSRASGAALALLDESPLPVAYVRRVADLEQVIHEQDLHVVFYVNQNAKNFQMMRYGRRWHVFINHGESDKMYMTTNQFKAYDYAFIAGEAARARLEKVLWDYDFDKRAIADRAARRPTTTSTARRCRTRPTSARSCSTRPPGRATADAAAYGSIASHGVALVRGLLATGRHRVIYRPHPRSGVVDHDYGAANRAIIAAIEAANAADPSAQHVYDDGPSLGWQLAAADVAIVDISAMVYDRLAAGKPLLITRPANPEAQIDTGGYLQACEWLDATDAAAMVARVDEVAHDADAARSDSASGSSATSATRRPGVTTARFHDAVDHLMAEWERFAALHADDEEVDEFDGGRRGRSGDARRLGRVREEDGDGRSCADIIGDSRAFAASDSP